MQHSPWHELIEKPYREDRHAPPGKRHKGKDEDEEEDLNDANFDEVKLLKKSYIFVLNSSLSLKSCVLLSI